MLMSPAIWADDVVVPRSFTAVQLLLDDQRRALKWIREDHLNSSAPERKIIFIKVVILI
jgi:hypothetical protein